jgi:hypothetical protein
LLKDEVDTTMMKRTTWRAAGCAVLLLTLAGCRQPEGALPAPEGEQTNRIDDISRDLQNIANNDGNAPAELLDDLTYLQSAPPPPAQLKALADALAGALRGADLSDEDAKRLAMLIFQMVAASELNQAQIAQIGSDLRAALVKAGATPEAADRVSAAGSALAGEVTENKKRWYHR